jgi:hypothetical protein
MTKKNKEILEVNWEEEERANRQQSEDGCDEGYVKGVGMSNSNIAKRCRYQCDFLDDDDIFIAKG